MMSMLKNPDMPFRDEIFIEFGRCTLKHDGRGGFQPYRTCVTEDYKLCINLLDRDELYNLKNDPEELGNLIDSSEYKKIRNELHDKILEWMNETRDPFRGYHWERRPWREDARLASLDYTKGTRQKPGDSSFTPKPMDYQTGMSIEM
jgi:uncharacterized sulfatase